MLADSHADVTKGDAEFNGVAELADRISESTQIDATGIRCPGFGHGAKAFSEIRAGKGRELEGVLHRSKSIVPNCVDYYGMASRLEGSRDHRS